VRRDRRGDRLPLARGGLADLFRELPSMRGAQLQAALARALGDPNLTVVYADGPEGRTIAALRYDPSLDDDPELVEAVTAAAAMALENERLHEQSAARLAELHASRERIVSAGDAERRRLERNLHDGAQQRLVSLAMQLRCEGADGLSEAIELAAYFVTSEALANVAKYARATKASVRVSRRGPRLVVEALDRRLAVVSPPGEGTIVTAELPHSTSAA
jgi:signal transduction histidine kinase